MLNRRLFIGAAVNTAGLMATAQAATLSVLPANTLPHLTQPWSQQLFAQLQGDTVFLKDAAGKVFEAWLMSVKDMGSTAELEQFAVSFAPSQSLPEGLYQLSHRTAGRCALYLSASDKSCTALFSLLRST